jgi:hypothetical protein
MLQLTDEQQRGTGGSAAASTAMSMLGEASSQEPLNVRLLVKAARLAASPQRKQGLGQPERAWKYLQEAASTLARLEVMGAISGADDD